MYFADVMNSIHSVFNMCPMSVSICFFSSSECHICEHSIQIVIKTIQPYVFRNNHQ